MGTLSGRPVWWAMHDDADWRKAALCAQTDQEAFFPEKGGSNKAAKAVCGRCEVRDQCLEWALDTQVRDGIWGGKSERERRAILKKRGTDLPPEPDEEEPPFEESLDWALVWRLVTGGRKAIREALELRHRNGRPPRLSHAEAMWAVELLDEFGVSAGVQYKVYGLKAERAGLDAERKERRDATRGGGGRVA